MNLLNQKPEPKLCPDCPLRGWVSWVKDLLKEKQMTRAKDEPTNLRVCMELRKAAREKRLNPCPYYPQNEDIGLFMEKNYKDKKGIKFAWRDERCR